MQSRNSHMTPRMTGETRLQAETLPTYLELWSADKRAEFLESMSCYLHNEGHSLQRNSAEFDVEWLARAMYANRTGGGLNDIERAGDDARQEYKAMAEAALACFPHLCERIGSRYVTAKAAIETELQRARACAEGLRAKR